MKTFLEIIRDALNENASEVFLLAGQPVMMKTGGCYMRKDSTALTPADTMALADEARTLGHRFSRNPDRPTDDRFSISLPGLSRVRLFIYSQRNSCAITARIIPFGIPDPAAVDIPKEVMDLAELTEGMVLITGASGSGKSTTLACLIDHINHHRVCHIQTLEDPIEYLFKNNRSFVSQREINVDTASFADGLKGARAAAPDVLMVSEIPSGTELRALVTLADTDRLIFSSVSAGSAPAAVLQLLGTLTGDERQVLAEHLASVLKYIVTEQLRNTEDGILPLFEVTAISDDIRRAIATGDSSRIRDAFSAADDFSGEDK